MRRYLPKTTLESAPLGAKGLPIRSCGESSIVVGQRTLIGGNPRPSLVSTIRRGADVKRPLVGNSQPCGSLSPGRLRRQPLDGGRMPTTLRQVAREFYEGIALCWLLRIRGRGGRARRARGAPLILRWGDDLGRTGGGGLGGRRGDLREGQRVDGHRRRGPAREGRGAPPSRQQRRARDTSCGLRRGRHPRQGRCIDLLRRLVDELLAMQPVEYGLLFGIAASARTGRAQAPNRLDGLRLPVQRSAAEAECGAGLHDWNFRILKRFHACSLSFRLVVRLRSRMADIFGECQSGSRRTRVLRLRSRIDDTVLWRSVSFSASESFASNDRVNGGIDRSAPHPVGPGFTASLHDDLGNTEAVAANTPVAEVADGP